MDLEGEIGNPQGEDDPTLDYTIVDHCGIWFRQELNGDCLTSSHEVCKHDL